MTTDEDLQKEIKELTKKSRELYLAAERQISAAYVAMKSIRMLSQKGQTAPGRSVKK